MAQVQIDTEMLRRAAEASRNFRRDHVTAEDCWFDWVPKHLDQIADRADDDARAKA